MCNHRRTARHLFSRVGLAVGILLVAWPLTTGSASTSLSQALSRVEKAFSEGATRHLRPLLPARGKILLSLPSLGLAEEYVSGSQCEYLLGDLFHRFEERSFHLETRTSPTPPGDRVTARGRLTVGGEGTERRVLSLHLLLSREDEAWTLREIREHTAR
jgi:hypothetical protein